MMWMGDPLGWQQTVAASTCCIPPAAISAYACCRLACDQTSDELTQQKNMDRLHHSKRTHTAALSVQSLNKRNNLLSSLKISNADLSALLMSTTMYDNDINESLMIY